MRIKNVRIYGEDQQFHTGEVVVEDGCFVAVEESIETESCLKPDSKLELEELMDSSQITDGEPVVDGTGMYLLPGLIDLHFHGCMGADMCDGTAEAIQIMAEYEASVGVTSICPATMTIPEEELHQVMRTAGSYGEMEEQNRAAEHGKTAEQPQTTSGARLVGINMEGPFISAAKKGAQASENIRQCDVSLFHSYQKDAKGLIKLVDIAPEEAGAMEFIDEVKGEVVVSLAHTAADYATGMEALRRGASHVTHLYNAMPPLNHREPGVIGAALDSSPCHVELICDGIHIHPAVIRATFAMFGSERVILISDSMRATGLTDGSYTLGGQAVDVRGNEAKLTDGTIAGSVTNLTDCLRFAVHKAGIPLEQAIAAATVNPAREIGIYEECGSISVGKRADFLLMDEDLELMAVYLAGEKII